MVVKALFGRVSDNEFILTPEQMETFLTVGCVTVENVLTEEEVLDIEKVFDRFISGEIHVPGKDFCDMSKPFGIPYEEWSIVNCMLPTTYHPPFQNNKFEQLTNGMAQQLFQYKYKSSNEHDSQKKVNGNETRNDNEIIVMVKDYDQLLNKRPGKNDAIFAWHQDMAYWPGPKTLGVTTTDTCTFSLAIDDSTMENGCLRYIPSSGQARILRPHRPLHRRSTEGGDRDEGHALVADVDETVDVVAFAPARRGSVTIHDEYVVHGSSGNTCPEKQRRTYVIAYRERSIVQAERDIGFTHSHNDVVNWDTFLQDQQNKTHTNKP